MSVEAMTEERAEQLFDKWVDILQLHEWDIRFHWKCDPKRMELVDNAGCTSYNWVCRQAVIQIADPDLYEMDMKGFAFDFEQILVHELLHLKFSMLDDTKDEMQNRHVHILVDGIARSLVRASREGNAEKAVRL